MSSKRATTKKPTAKRGAKKPVIKNKSKQEDNSDSDSGSSDVSDVETLDTEFVDAADIEYDDADDADIVDDADDVEIEEEDDDDDDADDTDDEADHEETTTSYSQNRINEFDFIYSDATKKPSTSKEIIVVKDENRVTSHMLSKTEITEAVSIRCAQIQKNPIVFVDIEGISNPIIMAKKEINERKCPLILRRFIGRYNSRDYYEYWDINEMSRPYIYEI